MNKRIKIAVIATTSLMHANANAASDIPQALVFDFPDGTRGGHGKIEGTGRWKGKAVNGMRLTPDSFYIDPIKKCGAKNVRFPTERWSHHRYVLADSTSKDRIVVACVIKRLPRDFSVSVGSPDLFYGERDDRLFRDFWTRSPEVR
jgi:hypothetical protein